ncbi:glutaminyl-peptide cyclotransferase-like isoform X1 [Actinidia eriantha]|uniref:glutaminyl-peptide cyclotransferase-like isoform X1 n=1 Tax=Actinidia eriantha TaxID=165200 RepID=UPI00258660BB|nr:glutaminyl-peptide cyclotransferase-like isoform X1 [Actinidia eriantha]
MAGGSLRKKPNKRSSPKPQASMASASSSPSNYRKRFLFFMVFLVVSVVGLVGISSSMWTGLGFAEHCDQICSANVVNEFPHDPGAFTQGLLYGGNDTLFESTGLYGQSSVRKVALQTGKVQAHYKMDDSYFGEGLTLLGERLFQVTWLENIGFIYDRNNLSKFEKFTHQMQDGWGLATDGKILFGSDGTSTLYQIDPQTLKVIQKHTVKYNDHEVHRLNELEYVNGEILANVWETDCIARISHEDGRVLGWILLPNLRQGLVAAGNSKIDVLNGIAWDSERNRLFVTGKLWPKLYEIELQPMREPIHGIIEQMCIQRPAQFGKP